MKTAFRILARDLGRLARNPVALIVMAGLIVLPALYAWYCIWANWDPYENTGNIRVAVANADAGADTEALGHIDVGSQVEANLQDDDQLGWEFVSEDEAVQGVESGRYYAAYVIPADFSADFASVLTGKPEHPTITYYANEKHSAVATKTCRRCGRPYHPLRRASTAGRVRFRRRARRSAMRSLSPRRSPRPSIRRGRS